MTHFRSYEAARLDLGAGGGSLVVLTGPNGAGKTNILEAVSLLVPGKGLRGADLLSMKSNTAGAEDLWAISAEIETSDGIKARIGTGLDAQAKRRIVRINGKDAKSQNELSDFIAAVWLTPQMDRLFLEGPSSRRKFLDRLVFAYEPAHVTRLNRYDKTMRERMALLQQPRAADPQWLTGLEAQLTGDGIAIAASRLSLLAHLQQHVGRLATSAPLFPQPVVKMTGWVEEAIQSRPAAQVEDEWRQKLAASRGLDREMGRTSEGIHRSDLEVVYAVKGMAAAQCSTGEQKALLVSIILAHALMMQAEKGFVPVTLLDEVAAHLDQDRREQLFSLLQNFNGQIWLTGTDESIFSSLIGKAKFFRIGNGIIPVSW